jgi:hypothetical protein
MTDDDMPTQGFFPADKELWERVRGSGELSEAIMRAAGEYQIDSQATLRKIVYAIAELERRLSATD